MRYKTFLNYYSEPATILQLSNLNELVNGDLPVCFH